MRQEERRKMRMERERSKDEGEKKQESGTFGVVFVPPKADYLIDRCFFFLLPLSFILPPTDCKREREREREREGVREKESKSPSSS